MKATAETQIVGVTLSLSAVEARLMITALQIARDTYHFNHPNTVVQEIEGEFQ